MKFTKSIVSVCLLAALGGCGGGGGSTDFAAKVEQGHSYPLTWTSDGSLLIGGNQENIFKSWGGSYFGLKQAVAGHDGWVQAVDFHINNRLLVSAGRDGALRFWLNDNGEIGSFGTSVTGLGTVLSVDFNPLLQTLAVAGSDGKIQLWDYARRTLTKQWVAHGDASYVVKHSPDGQLLASAGADGKVRLWEAVTGELLADLGQHNGGVHQLVFTNGSSQLLSAGEDGVIQRWDTYKHLALGEVGRHDVAIYALDLAADGVTLASGDADGVVGIWSLDTAAKALEPAVRQFSVAESGAVQNLSFNPVTTLLAVSTEDAQLRIWDINREQVEKQLILTGTQGPSKEKDRVINPRVAAIHLNRLVFDSLQPVLLIEKLLEQPERLANAFLLDVNTAELACPDQGSYQFVFNDTDADQLYASVDDQFSVTADKCQEGFLRSSGTYTLRLINASQTAVAKEKTTELTLQQLDLVDRQRYSTVVDGTASAEVVEPLSAIEDVLTTTTANNLRLSATNGVIFDLSTLEVEQAKNPASDVQSISYDARFSLTDANGQYRVAEATYQVETLVPLQIGLFDEYPSQGRWRIRQLTGGDQVAEMTVLSNGLVQLHVVSTEGVSMDYNQTITWPSLTRPFQTQ